MVYKDEFWWGWRVGSVVKNTSLAENLNSLPSIHMVAYKWFVTPVPGEGGGSTPDLGWQ